MPDQPTNNFPLHVFPAEVQSYLRHAAENKSIPLNYLGSSALFTIAALSGNMYKLQVDEGIIKPIIFMALIGPSGVGKSPAYNNTCGRLVKDLRWQQHNDWKQEHSAWKQTQKKSDQHVPEPHEVIRITEEGTTEAFEKYAGLCPAGFGVFYDEGERLFTTGGAYKKDSNVVGFWNSIYNGDLYNAVRVDSERNRFINDPCISVIMGLQRDRVLNYFTDDVIKSGLFGRFLFTESNYIPLNTQSNALGRNGTPGGYWYDLVRHLFMRGIKFEAGKSYNLPIDADAVADFDVNRTMFKMSANMDMMQMHEGTVDELMLAYSTKLYVYFQKFCILLAILDDRESPVIRKEHVYNAVDLYNYYKQQARNILTELHGHNQTGLSTAERLLLDALPDIFSRDQANAKCKELGLNDGFFRIALHRKYMNKFLRKTTGGHFQKV